MRIFLISVLLLLTSLSSTQASSWIKTTSTTLSDIEKKCFSNGKYTFIPAENFRVIDTFKNGSSVVTVCRWSDSRIEFLESSYFIKYNIEKKEIDLHMESEMMTWGASVKTEGFNLNVDLYWPSDKSSKRKVREFHFSCDKNCTVKESCIIEKLKTDQPPEQLFKFITEKTKNKKTKFDFIGSSKKENVLALDQLFMESLAGNVKAQDLMKKLYQDTDSSSAELMGSYLSYIDEMKPLRCRWH